MRDFAPSPETATLGSLLEWWSRTSGDKPFLRDSTGTLSWREFRSSTKSISAYLWAEGLRPGERVVLALENGREFLYAWFALALIGVVEVPLSPSTPTERLTQVLSHCSPQAIIAAPGWTGRMPAGAVRTISSEAIRFAAEGGSWPSELTEFPARGRQPAAILYTSGTTGAPKGVIVPVGQHITNGLQAARAARITADDTIHVSLPLHHNMAQGYGVWPALVTGASVWLGGRFDRRMFWSDVSRAGSTVLPFVGDMLALLSKNEVTPDEQRSSLRVGYGVPIPAGLHLELEERFSMQLVHAYGSTEATIPVWSAGSERIPGSAGRVIDGFDVQIWDDSHQQLGVDAVGEIVVRAHLPNMMFSGYYKDEGRTSAAWSGGWFLSGDYGCFDQYGNLWFKGRRDEAIRHHGELIHPTGLEEIAEAHHAISAAAVVGVRSELAEDDILMVVELAPGCDLAAADLHTWLAERCARFELPRYIEFTGQLPRTPTGKVERYRFKDRGPTQGAYDSRQARSSYG